MPTLEMIYTSPEAKQREALAHAALLDSINSSHFWYLSQHFWTLFSDILGLGFDIDYKDGHYICLPSTTPVGKKLCS